MFGIMSGVCALCLMAGVERDTPTRVVQGEVRCRVLLIDFEGREHVHPPEAFETIFFGNNVRFAPDESRSPIIGSARDYYDRLSDGRLRLTGKVMPWVRSRLKPEDLPHWKKTGSGDHDWWQRVAADAMSLNRIPKDDRIDGKPVDFYAMIYSGPIDGYFKRARKKLSWGAGRRVMSKSVFHKYKVPFWDDRWHGKHLTYSPERLKQEPSGIYHVGLLFHELGHQLCGFRDLYNKGYGPFGRYAIMANGERTHFPTGPTAFHRYMAGWLSYDVPAQKGRRTLRLPPLCAVPRAVKLVNGPMPWADALIVEHRSGEGKTLPAEGLLVYEAYGNRRVRTAKWDEKAKKYVTFQQRIRLLRADGTQRNQPGDVFRQGRLPLFGNVSAASSATGCGFWELEKITVPAAQPGRRGSSSRSKAFATFEAVYCPKRIPIRRRSSPIHLSRRIPPGDHRVYVRVAHGGCTVKGNGTLLRVPGAGNRVAWGLCDVRIAANDRQTLSAVPDDGAKIEEIQVVPRAPVLLDLMGNRDGEKLAASLGGHVSESSPLDKNVWVGGAIEIPLGQPGSAKATVPVECPGGVLRLAMRVSARKKEALPTVTLVIREGGKAVKMLDRVALHKNRPEFFLVDCARFRGKPISLELLLKGPKGSRVVLWDATFAAN